MVRCPNGKQSANARLFREIWCRGRPETGEKPHQTRAERDRQARRGRPLGEAPTQSRKTDVTCPPARSRCYVRAFPGIPRHAVTPRPRGYVSHPLRRTVRVLAHYQALDCRTAAQVREEIADLLVARLVAVRISRKLIKMLPPDSVCLAASKFLPPTVRNIPDKMPPREVAGTYFQPPRSISWQLAHRTVTFFDHEYRLPTRNDAARDRTRGAAAAASASGNGSVPILHAEPEGCARV